MDDIRQLADEIYRGKVELARSMTTEQKLLAGPELFDLACKFMRAGIRLRHPDADDHRVEEMLRERLRLARKLEENSASFDTYVATCEHGGEAA